MSCRVLGQVEEWAPLVRPFLSKTNPGNWVGRAAASGDNRATGFFGFGFWVGYLEFGHAACHLPNAKPTRLKEDGARWPRGEPWPLRKPRLSIQSRPYRWAVFRLHRFRPHKALLGANTKQAAPVPDAAADDYTCGPRMDHRSSNPICHPPPTKHICPSLPVDGHA